MLANENPNSIYEDEYPSSWSTDINIVRGFCGVGYSGLNGKGLIMKGLF